MTDEISKEQRKRKNKVIRRIRTIIMFGLVVVFCSAAIIIATAIMFPPEVPAFNETDKVSPGNNVILDNTKNASETASAQITDSYIQISPTPEEPTQEPTKEPTHMPQVNRTIMLDPGHGGPNNPGCCYGGYEERHIALSVALKTRDKLQSMGYTVIMTRDDDSAIGLYERSDKANNTGADLFVSIHMNALENNTTYNGIETWYNENKEQSQRLAQLIQDEASRATGARNLGIISDNGLVVIRETNMPSCLLECGYMSNESERNRLITDAYQDKLADAISVGIHNYFT